MSLLDIANVARKEQPSSYHSVIKYMQGMQELTDPMTAYCL